MSALVQPHNGAPLHKLLLGLAVFGVASIGVTVWNVVDLRRQRREFGL